MEVTKQVAIDTAKARLTSVWGLRDPRLRPSRPLFCVGTPAQEDLPYYVWLKSFAPTGDDDGEDEGWSDQLLRRSAYMTDDRFWDCECEHNYIHFKAQESCAQCGAFQCDQPDSMTLEVPLYMLEVAK
jgi:hypothetical protein